MSRDLRLALAVAFGLAVAGVVVAAVVLLDPPPASPTPDAGTPDHGMAPDARCEHMPEHCEAPP